MSRMIQPIRETQYKEPLLSENEFNTKESKVELNISEAIKEKRKEIQKLYVNNLGVSKIFKSNRKPSPLRRFEEGLMKFFLNENSEIMNLFPSLRRELRREDQKKENELDEKIDTGPLIYLYLKDAENVEQARYLNMQSRKLKGSNMFQVEPEKDFINDEYNKILNEEFSTIKSPLLRHAKDKKKKFFSEKNASKSKQKLKIQKISPEKEKNVALTLSNVIPKIPARKIKRNVKTASNSKSKSIIIQPYTHQKGSLTSCTLVPSINATSTSFYKGASGNSRNTNKSGSFLAIRTPRGRKDKSRDSKSINSRYILNTEEGNNTTLTTSKMYSTTMNGKNDNVFSTTPNLLYYKKTKKKLKLNGSRSHSKSTDPKLKSLISKTSQLEQNTNQMDDELIKIIDSQHYQKNDPVLYTKDFEEMFDVKVKPKKKENAHEMLVQARNQDGGFSVMDKGKAELIKFSDDITKMPDEVALSFADRITEQYYNKIEKVDVLEKEYNPVLERIKREKYNKLREKIKDNSNIMRRMTATLLQRGLKLKSKIWTYDHKDDNMSKIKNLSKVSFKKKFLKKGN